MDRDITYQLDYPYCRCSYEIAPDPTASFDADKFSFAQCPIVLDDLLEPVDIRMIRKVLRLNFPGKNL